MFSQVARDGGIRNLEFTFEKKILQNLFTLPTIKIIKSETSAPIARVEIKCKKEPKFEREMFLAFDNDFLSKSEHSKQKYKNIEEKKFLSSRARRKFHFILEKRSDGTRMRNEISFNAQ